MEIGSSREWVEFLANNPNSRNVETPSRFALRMGRQFPLVFGDIPHRAKRVPKGCFENVFDLAVGSPSISYCEGWACHEVFPMPTEHAWGWDGEKIIDPTWDNKGTDYFGAEFSSETVMRIALITKVYGILGSWWKWPEVLAVLRETFAMGKEVDDAGKNDRAVPQV